MQTIPTRASKTREEFEILKKYKSLRLYPLCASPSLVPTLRSIILSRAILHSYHYGLFLDTTGRGKLRDWFSLARTSSLPQPYYMTLLCMDKRAWLFDKDLCDRNNAGTVTLLWHRLQPLCKEHPTSHRIDLEQQLHHHICAFNPPQSNRMPSSSTSQKFPDPTSPRSTGSQAPKPPVTWTPKHDAFIREKARNGEDAESIHILFDVEFPAVGGVSRAWVRERMELAGRK